MNNKFLDKVCDQIMSETIIDDKGLMHTPFTSSPLPASLSFLPLYPHLRPSLFSLSKHCKDVYSLNEQETEYVWTKYKEGIVSIINNKEPAHQEKVW